MVREIQRITSGDLPLVFFVLRTAATWLTGEDIAPTQQSEYDRHHFPITIDDIARIRITISPVTGAYFVFKESLRCSGDPPSTKRLELGFTGKSI